MIRHDKPSVYLPYLVLLALIGSLLACLSGGGAKGETCISRCEDDLVCAVFEGDDEGVCVDRCDEASRFCGDGSICRPFDSESGICTPNMGTVTTGNICKSARECEVGHSCITGLEAEGRCWRACEPGASTSTCDEGEQCIGFGAGNEGLCQPILNQASCDLEAGETCPSGYECGYGEAGIDANTSISFLSVCNIPDCVTDEDCPGSAVCRDSHGYYKQDESWTSLEAPRKQCYQTCEGQDACSALAQGACVTESECRGLTEGSEACLAFLDKRDICVPGLLLF